MLFCMLCGCSRQSGRHFDDYRLGSAEELQRLLVQSENYPGNLEVRIAIWDYYLATGQFDALNRHATPVYLAAEVARNNTIRAYAGSYLAQSYMNLDRYDSVKYYLTAVTDLAQSRKLHSLIAVNHNTAALYALAVEVDYVDALRHLRMALDISHKTNNNTNAGILLGCIADIYLQRNDAKTGLPYAEEAYRIGKATHDKYVLGQNISILSRSLLLEGRYDEALSYAEELLALCGESGMIHRRSTAHLLLGEIYSKKGEPWRAELYYNKAIGGGNSGDEQIEIGLGYGNFLLEARRYDTARERFASALAISDNTRSIKNKHKLLLGLSHAYRGLGDKDRALTYYDMYRTHTDSIFTIQNEQAFNKLSMHYERIEHQRQIDDKERSLLLARRNNHIHIFVIVCIAIVSGSIYLLYRRKNRMYRQLVEQHHKYLHRKKQVEQLGNAEENNGDATFYRQVEELMSVRHIYRHKDISLDKLAEILGTNRVYISRAINQYAGMSFYDYIHSKRISEAVALLSDRKNDTPLKVLSDQLGYNSISAFYRYFQKETGVPPSKYREQARRLHLSDQN